MIFEYFTYLCDCKLLAHLWNGTLYDWQHRFRFHVVPESWCKCRQHSQSPQETPPWWKNTVFVLKYLLFGRWPLEEVSLFLCKGKWNLADYMGHRWLWVAQSISNNLKKASGGEKAQRYKDLHSCRVYHARYRNHFLVFLFSMDD